MSKLRIGDIIYINHYRNAYDLYGNEYKNAHYEKCWVVRVKQNYFYWNDVTKRLERNDVLLMNCQTRQIIRIHSRYVSHDTKPNPVIKHKDIATK